MKAISECGFEHPSEGTWRSPFPDRCSAEPVHSEGSDEGGHSLPGPIRNGKDLRVYYLRAAKHQALLQCTSSPSPFRVDQLHRLLPHERDGRSDVEGVPSSEQVPSRPGDYRRVRRHVPEEERRRAEEWLRYPDRHAAAHRGPLQRQGDQRA